MKLSISEDQELISMYYIEVVGGKWKGLIPWPSDTCQGIKVYYLI